jgi:hypothetical protein
MPGGAEAEHVVAARTLRDDKAPPFVMVDFEPPMGVGAPLTDLVIVIRARHSRRTCGLNSTLRCAAPLIPLRWLEARSATVPQDDEDFNVKI